MRYVAAFQILWQRSGDTRRTSTKVNQPLLEFIGLFPVDGQQPACTLRTAAVQFEISNFGFALQDSSDFEISLLSSPFKSR